MHHRADRAANRSRSVARGETPAASFRPCPLLTLSLMLMLGAFAPAIEAQVRKGAIFEIALGKVNFEDAVYEGDSGHIDLGIAFVINPNYEIGIGFGYNAYFSPSIDRGPDSDYFYTETRYIHLRRHWYLGDDTGLFGQVGYARIEIESEDVSVCLFFCQPQVNSRTTYRNKESGWSWGVGIQHRYGHQRLWSLGYVDYSDSDFEFSGWHLGFRYNMIE